MSDIVCYDSDGRILDHYTQWDVNQKLIIRGADESSAPQFHFSNRLTDRSIIVSSVIRDGAIVADIPDVMLRSAEPIIVHMYYDVGGSGRSKYSVRIPVAPKKKPEDYLYSDGDGGIVLDHTSIVIDDEEPQFNSVLWFNTASLN